jgi:tRNA A-37 threonylcarbamoyl transferase component Bud32
VARLHRAGFVHRDLHVGNILIDDLGPVLLDLQRVRASHEKQEHMRDIGSLDFSLGNMGVSRVDRLRFRSSALSLGEFRLTAARENLRAAGRASEDRALDYYRGRTRRSLKPGPEIRRIHFEDQSGLRVASLSSKAIHLAILRHRDQIENGGPDLIKSDHRSRVSGVEIGGTRFIVKEVVKGSRRKWIADVFRGSAARRAWVAGHGLQIRGIGAPAPLAFVERRRYGIPVASLIILEDLRPARALDSIPPDQIDAAQLADLLLRLVLRIHRTGVTHGDLQSLHILMGPERELSLIDLEGVRFRRRLEDDQRIQALAELNASLADERIPADIRGETLRHYLRELPFDRGNNRAVLEIVKRSLARKQHWKGTDCDLSPYSD